ncbi:MAG: hypothetical protein F9K09_01465 [Flavobacteriales bacterium]|nr:MAG: hypothetical protein F9K09_01465 [Flavobacteriales bacterium]
MSLERKYSIYRKIAVFMAVNLLVEIFAPTAVWALTGGPSSPEFTSFEPVATTNMVSEFSGDLTYNLPVINIPGADGGGYAMSLSYHSGTTPEEESSWVGYGWTLNPGAINRGKKGFPDDWDADPSKKVKYHNLTPANETVALGGSLGNFETFGYDIPLSVNSSIRYNNYNGFGYTIGAGLSLAKGVVSLGYNISDGSGSFSLSINPAAALRGNKDKGGENDKKTRAQEAKIAFDKKKAAIDKLKDGTKRTNAEKNKIRQEGGISSKSALGGLGSGYGMHNFASANRPTQIVGYTGISTTVAINFIPEPSPIPVGPSVGTFGSYSRQENNPENDLKAIGYMYSKDAESGDMMDYFVEKGSTYTKQDKFLGIPFSNADDFTLTGEGLSGGFKMHHKKVGKFHPNFIESNTSIFNVGAEVQAGLNWGVGADVGAGLQTLTIEQWEQPTGDNGFANTEDESIFFRFANDKGGELSYDNGVTIPKQANIQLTNEFIGLKQATANMSGIETGMLNNSQYNRSLRSSYIGYNTNEEMVNAIEGTVAYKAYAKNTSNHIDGGSINRSELKQIGEYSIVNEDGGRYNYGIPVLSKEEKNLQVDLDGVSGSQIYNKFLVERNINYATKTKVGEERNRAYASAYLLTSITTPDYIDRTNNGPSDDDFGGYTSFNYHKAYGAGIDDVNPDGQEDWYKWRMPYAGLSYNRNELSNTKDDLGSVAEGYKEIYYLKTVETKTHYAVFHTSKRRDGLDAHHDSGVSSSSLNAKGDFKLQKLDKIELFAKDLSNPSASGKLIKTVHFEYDYTTAVGVFNYNSHPDDDNSEHNEGGKLTLKKVWFEYNGVVEAKISPYQFEYEYSQADYPSEYDNLEDYKQLYASNDQNPTYSPFNIDAWGNYQNDGTARYFDMKPWLNQNKYAPTMASFDPAAWQLKVIKLPSGGEIHVQYEQDDYCYVQNKQAHAMVSLANSSNHSAGTFLLNTSDLGIGLEPDSDPLAENQKLAAIISKEYITGNKKMYFKMLYKLIGNSTPGLNDCNTEYITGYANVSSVVGLPNGIGITLASGGYSLPKQVCEDYVTSQRAGTLSSVGSDCDPSVNGLGGEDAIEKVFGFIGQAFTWLASIAPGTTCLEVNYEKSYLKIPMLDAKKGGGVRVKRLLMYDKGLDTGSPELYGSEYIYKVYDEERKEYRSSGVATNEPGSIREENVLVGFMDRFKQSFADKVISGRDKEQSEGPLGESILPGASVGYSRIISKSIHSGKTNPGFAVKEFYTAKDYPVKMEMTGIDQTQDYLPLYTGLVNKITNNLWLSQGFAFEVNSMHGQLRSSSTYAGDYSTILDPTKSTLISSEVLDYFQPGESLPILNTEDLSIMPLPLPLGKEMDMVIESKSVKDINIDGNVEMDANAGLFGILVFPFLTAFPSMTFSETELYTHVTTKVTSYPAIVKKTTSYADGIYHVSENVAFNPENGQPIVVRTTDGFDKLDLLASTNHKGDYTKYDFPASLEYENVSQIAKNERKNVHSTGGISISKIEENGKTYLSFSASPPATSVCEAMSNFVGGDLIKLSTGGLYHTGDIKGSKLEIQPTYYSSQAQGNNLGTVAKVEIIRSGRTNQLNANVGSLTTYGTKDVVVTTIDPDTLALRQKVADKLNQSLNSVLPLAILPADMSVVIDGVVVTPKFFKPDGTCSVLEDGNYIIVDQHTGKVNIYGPDILIVDTIISGTPGKPHRMVDALNDYLDTYHGYNLTLDFGSDLSCGSAVNYRYALNSEGSIPAMRASQQQDLAVQFSGINNGTHAINEFFTDEGWTTNTIVEWTANKNIKVVLEELSTGNQMGVSFNCSSSSRTSISNCVEYNIPTHGEFVQTAQGYLAFQESQSSNLCETDIRFYTLNPLPPIPNLLCSSQLEMSGEGGNGHFEIDPKTANLVYYAQDNNCYPQDVPCIRFCDEKYPSASITNVVASEASTLNDRWDNNESPNNGFNHPYNDYELGKRGKWRTEHTFAYKTEVDRLSSTPSFDKNYNSGTYNLELFNWKKLNANGHKWLALNTVKKYSPNGNALEEENILGIKSAAKFGYHKTLPYLIAQNAAYTSIAFESFENNYGAFVLEDGVVYDDTDGQVDASTSHSGKSSFKLTFPANNGVEMTEMKVTEQILTKGMLFKVWVKTDFSDRTILDTYLKAGLKDVNNNLYVPKNFKKVAQVGDWYLYQAKMLPTDLAGMTIGDVLKTYVKYEFTAHGSENVWIDDVRIQPMDAQSTAYVYDVDTHRLLTTFDDQHFGLFYQYNAEGKLVRKLIETERGMKTVQETQYNTPKIPR